MSGSFDTEFGDDGGTGMQATSSVPSVEIHQRLKQSAPEIDFAPNPLVRPALLQTVLSARLPDKIAQAPATEYPVIVEAGPDETGYASGTRLLVYLSMQQMCAESRGLVITLHGWEGCSHAVFGLTLMDRLLDAGYDVARLNLRDHGPGYHVDPRALNPGVFLGTLLDESHRAVQSIAAWSDGKPVYLVGPSMGGNFVLRMAARHTTHPIPNLRRVLSISPALDPGDATDQIDAHWYLSTYFRGRWIKSLRSKQSLFPQLYDFESILGERSLRQITDWLIKRYTRYSGADEYFAHYAVTPRHIGMISVPTTVLTAADDPVCRPSAMQGWPEQPDLNVAILPYGGHVGFVDIWPIQHRLPDLILAEMES